MKTYIKELDIAQDLIKKYGETGAYDIATWILNRLEHRHYCIWQTYDKDDIAINYGRKPTDEEMDNMQENLSNCFEYIRLED